MEGYLALLIVNFTIYLDARILQQQASGQYSEIMKSSPRKWAILAFLLFIIFAPLYYYRRRKLLAIIHSTSSEDLSPEEINPHFSRIIEATEIVFRWFFLLIGFSFLYVIFSQVFQILNTDLMEYAVIGELSSISMVILIYIAIKKHRSEGFWKSLSVKKGELFVVKSILVPGIIGITLATVNFLIFHLPSIEAPSPLGQALEGGTILSIVLFLGMALLTAPLLEELIFRGYFFSTIQEIKGKVYAIVSISLLFALFHVEQLWGDWVSILLILCLGFCLTFLRSWSGSTISGIVTHYVYNTSVVIILPLLTVYFANPAYFKYSFMAEHLDPTAKEHLLQQSINTHPEDIPAYNDLAWLYATQGENLHEALTLIETALLSEPENAMFLDTKAEILYKLHRYDEAITIEETLVKQYPTVSFYQEQLLKYKTAKRSENSIVE